jgi:hypothetical protein
VITLEELQGRHRWTWEISTELLSGVAAWRYTGVTPAMYQAGLLNVVLAGDLEELAKQLAQQDSRQCQAGEAAALPLGGHCGRRGAG